MRLHAAAAGESWKNVAADQDHQNGGTMNYEVHRWGCCSTDLVGEKNGMTVDKEGIDD